MEFDWQPGILTANEQQILTFANPEARRLAGLLSRDPIGQPVRQLPAPLAELFFSAFEEGSPPTPREVLLQTEGKTETIGVAAHLRKGTEGKPSEVLLFLQDLTRLRGLQRQLQEMDRLVSIGRLSAGLAHEVKNRLVTVKTFTQLLPERHDDEEFRKNFTHLIGHEVHRIDSIVNQLLRFSRPSSAQFDEVKLHDAVIQSLQLIEPQTERKGVQIVKELNAPDDRIRADEAQLEQVFLNFYLNALDAMPEGGSLRIATRTVAEDSVEVTIADTGVGIRPEDAPHVFEHFFTRKAEGTGLGLSVSRSIIVEHGGRVDFESKLNEGTTFRILFPLIRSN
ncbi:MAG: PAS domain-containing protein [Verrucomicrobiae bacterium]|nr:PAS domain-containing protein [Verrucomicrobiae bacterium]